MLAKWVIRGTAMMASILFLTGCGSSGIDADEVSGVPEDWITTTKEGWPESKSFGSSTPILTRDDCELLDDPPEILGSTPDFTDTGWAALGSDPNDQDAYRYRCSIWSRDNYAGEIELLHPGSDTEAQDLITEFKNQPSTAEQDNSATTETVGDLDVHVVERWYPTNPQGRYLALFYDEDAEVLVKLDISSLDKADFDAFSAQKAADTLIDVIAAGS